MSNERASIFDDDLDLSEFKPKPPARAEEVREVARKAGFSSREPSPPDPMPEPEPEPEPVRREQRRYRTGRNVQLNLKVRQEDMDAFYQLADQEGIVLGEAFARAVAVWKRSLSES
ncbi:hypothetical protein [Rubellimicrobium aerolatum]|uniref:Stability/partitioning determinant n=1 Tax=Rubellimicrobium aerolatum TaxID=490979 RepID=A0ABW0SEQ5_9RHOB|nr:hypothetical protein [Rubellimicrobium aerolatum]MBP1806918.1 hypothetical protein [Rubellimicrobium aerolatum]